MDIIEIQTAAEEQCVSPLLFSVIMRDEEMALKAFQWSLQHDDKAICESRHDYGYTWLHHACEGGMVTLLEVAAQHPSRIQQIIDGKTDDVRLHFHNVQSGGRTPLHFAALYAGDEESQCRMIGSLVKAGATKDVQDLDGNTPEMLAISKGFQKAGELLRCEGCAAPDMASMQEKRKADHELANARVRHKFQIPEDLREPYVLSDALTRQECKIVLDAVEACDWSTCRHRSDACTVDIPVETVPSLDAWLRPLLQARIFPAIVQRHAWVESLSFRELFIVKYEWDGQTHVKLHRDGSVISFNILLSRYGNDFSGGGTFLENIDRTVHIERGQCLVHSGLVRHGSQPVTAGKRVIIVGFLECAHVQAQQRIIPSGNFYYSTRDT